MKSAIYTRTGDKGMTGLVSGERVLKSDDRVELYGSIDYLNSYIGLVDSLLEHKIVILKRLQINLFNLGSQLACVPERRVEYKLPKIDSSLIESIESEINKMDKDLPKLKNFILPGGTIIASHIHIARSLCRSVERKMVHLNSKSKENEVENALVLLNRMSDYLFVLGRFVNYQTKVEEVLWE